jgi:RHS repeat-associated protein
MTDYAYDRAVLFASFRRAVQRYYASAYGRFNTVDPLQSSAKPKNPGSWNRFAYVGGDPVNLLDPRGMEQQGADPIGPATLRFLVRAVHPMEAVFCRIRPQARRVTRAAGTRGAVPPATVPQIQTRRRFLYTASLTL